MPFAITDVRDAVERGMGERAAALDPYTHERITEEVWRMLHTPAASARFAECPYRQCHHCPPEGCLHAR